MENFFRVVRKSLKTNEFRVDLTNSSSREKVEMEEKMPASEFCSSIIEPVEMPQHPHLVQTQYNLYVHGQLHETAGDNYHRIYDLGSDSENLPKTLGDVRILASKDFQSVSKAYLESSITSTVMLTEK